MIAELTRPSSQRFWENPDDPLAEYLDLARLPAAPRTNRDRPFQPEKPPQRAGYEALFCLYGAVRFGRVTRWKAQ